jgi:hypothetical protein
MASSNSGIRSLDELTSEQEKKALPSIDELMKDKEKTPVTIPTQETIGPAPKSEPTLLPFPKFSGNQGDEYIHQFMSTSAHIVGEFLTGIVNLPIERLDKLGMKIPTMKNPSEMPTRSGLPNESIARVAGGVYGGALAGQIASVGIGNILDSAYSKFPQAGKAIINLSRGFFTAATFVDGLKKSLGFYNALKAGDKQGMEDSATGVLVDTVFGGLMAHGWHEDAIKLKALHGQMINERVARARNVTPQEAKVENAKTLEEAKSNISEPEPDLTPSVELQTHVDAKENLAESKAKVEEVKSQPIVYQAEPKMPDVKITGAQFDEIMKLTGKDIDDVTDQDAEDYLSGKLKPVEKPTIPEQVEQPEPDIDETWKEAKEAFGESEPGVVPQVEKPKFETPIEQHYEKHAEEITDSEVTKFYNLEEPVKDIDVEVGTAPEHNVLLSASDSPYSMDKDSTENSRANYSRSKSVATSPQELLNLDPTGPQKDPGTTVWAQVAEVNGWLHGDDKVDIESKRNFLSQLAANAEAYRYQFAGGEDYPQSFYDWKENVSDAANWARKAERPVTQDQFATLHEGDKKFVEKYMKRYSKTSAYSARYQLEAKGIIRKPTSEEKTDHLGTKQSEYEKALAEGKIKLMRSGGPGTEEIMKALSTAADNVISTYNKAKEVSKPSIIEIKNKIKRNLNRYGIDTAKNITDEFISHYKDPGFEVVMAHDAARNASSLARVQLQQAFKEIYNGLSKKEVEVIDKLTRSMRMIAISKSPKGAKFHFPPGYTPQESEAYIATFENKEKLTPIKAKELQRRADAFFEWAKQPVKDALAEGLISKEEADDLLQYNYLKTKLADLYDRESPIGGIGSIRRSVYDSGVEPLQLGKQTDIYEPSSKLLMMEQFDRMYGRVMNFRANKALQQFAWDNKGNDLVRSKIDSKGEETEEVIPPGWKPIAVGEKDKLYISPLMAKEWTNNSREISYMLANILRIGSGTAMLRPFATGLDWGFALANFGRHLVHAQFSSRILINGKWEPIYNPVLPITIGQLTKNLNSVIPDLLTRSGQYVDYLKEGATLRSLTGEGLDIYRRGRHIPDAIDGIMEFGGKLGNMAEATVRLAVRNQTISFIAKKQGLSFAEAYKDKGIRQMGTYAANTYLPFGQGGGAIKALNNMFPFLNASVQASRSIIRPFTANAKSSAYSFLRLAQFGMVAVGAWYVNRLLNPKTMKELEGNSVTEGNIVIPLGDKFATQVNGQTCYPYFKIPVAQSLRFFKVVFEDAAALAIGHKQKDTQLLDSLKRSSPAEVSLIPPFMAAREAYLHNYDVNSGKDIMPKEGLFSWPNSAVEIKHWDPPPQALQDLGKFTGLSPERMRRAGGDIVTSNSMWFNLAGKGYEFAFGDANQKYKNMTIFQILADIPLSDRFFGMTIPISKYSKEISEEKEKSNLKTWIQNLGLDTEVDKYLSDVNYGRGNITSYIHTFRDVKVQDRLYDRMQFAMEMRKLDDERWWANLRGLPAEARAELYWKRKSESNDEELGKMRREESQVLSIESSKLKGSMFNILTNDFYDELSRVRRGITK